MADIFISYSRKDSDFVRRLHGVLQSQNREVWVDWEDIPLTADWWQEICRAIDAADAFAFVITPDSVLSEVCRNEINYAVGNHKRFIPIYLRDITGVDRTVVHPAIQSHNWIPFTPDQDFDFAVKRLIEALNIDLSHVRTHSRLLTRAREWEAKSRAAGYLLTGGELREYRDWLQTNGEKEPKPTPLQLEYILTSQSTYNRRQLRVLIGSFASVVIALGLIALTLFQRQQLTAAEATSVAQQIFSTEIGGTRVALETRIAQQQTQARQDAENLITQVNLGLTQQVLITELADARATAEAANALLTAIFRDVEVSDLSEAAATQYNEPGGGSLTQTAIFTAQPASTSLVLPEPTEQFEMLTGGELWVSSGGNDANPCDAPERACLTLGAALAKALPQSTIHLDLGVYTGRLEITQSVAIIGNDRDLTYIVGDGSGPVMTIAEDVDVILSGVTITGGTNEESGGGIVNRGSLTIDLVTVVANSAQGNGGGIANFGTLNIANSDVVSNYARNGGGIYNAPTAVLNLDESTVALLSNTGDEQPRADLYIAPIVEETATPSPTPE